MLVLLVLLVVTVVVVRVALKRRRSLSLWWTRTVGPIRPWLSHSLGMTPTFGSLQRAVLADAIRQRTVSVTGSVWLPAQLLVELAEEDQQVIEHAPGPFLADVAEALTTLAGEQGWRLDGAVTLSFADEPTAKRGLPRVTVACLTGPLADVGAIGAPSTGAPSIGAGAARPAQAAAPAPTIPPAPTPAPSWVPAPAPQAVAAGPAGLPPTVPYRGSPASVPNGSAATPATVGGTELIGHDGSKPVRAPGLLLDPESGEASPIVLGATDDGTIIGRTGPADIVVSEPTVSAQHCRLVLDGSRWCIEDLDSSNGTLINGERIAGRRHLTSGDVVGLGRRARYRVHL
jgi:hypothetical protein